jgi:hypothetical protein
LISPFTKTTQQIHYTRQWRTKSSPTFQPKTILVTGVGMSKGLTIARTFYRAGHKVIGADFEPYYIPVCGRFSRSLFRFYRVSKPKSGLAEARRYIQDLVYIVKKEKVELWISCSGVASAIEDGEAKETIEKLTNCKAVQFCVDITSTLHDKDTFIENTKRLGLNVPETYPVKSETEALSVLFPRNEEDRKNGRKYIMKSMGMDDSIRADMTLLPLSSKSSTIQHISALKPSPSRPFVLQQFISGPEYCTHSIAIRGRIVAFTACRSSELLMHYRAMDPESALFKAFLKYTEMYAKGMGNVFTGHFSMDFLVDEDGMGEGEGAPVEGLMRRIWPIECNPRAHTAAILFGDRSEEVAEAYLSLLLEDDGNESRDIVMPGSDAPEYYWIGHDLVTRVLLPILYFLQGKAGGGEVIGKWMEFVNHVRFWKDGTHEIWDPWPIWWLYVIYWPGMFWVSILERNWWSRCNVSTTKLFRCS